MSRPLRIGLIALGVIVFLVISGLLARFLSVENRERDADLALLQAEAAGNLHSLVGQLQGCSADAVCVSLEKANIARVRRAGAVKILELTSGTSYSLTGATGLTRIAWTVIGHLPVVQCIRVHRRGNALTGESIILQGLSAPIAGTAVCS